jgi:hypothetical protein
VDCLSCPAELAVIGPVEQAPSTDAHARATSSNDFQNLRDMDHLRRLQRRPLAPNPSNAPRDILRAYVTVRAARTLSVVESSKAAMIRRWDGIRLLYMDSPNMTAFLSSSS